MSIKNDEFVMYAQSQAPKLSSTTSNSILLQFKYNTSKLEEITLLCLCMLGDVFNNKFRISTGYMGHRSVDFTDKLL